VPRPDAGLEAALDQRRNRLDLERQVLAEREMALRQEMEQLAAAEARVRMVLLQMDAAQQSVPGAPLPVAMIGDLERLLRWCEAQVVVQRERLEAVRGEADGARAAVATAHQAVRALELVLEARAAERAEKVRRAELRDADEIAARVHQKQVNGR
jgi:flagellar FliJ-like protein